MAAVLLTSVRGEKFWFDPGALCFEFAVTGGEGHQAAYESLHTPRDLAHWIEQAIETGVDPATEKGLSEARALREAIWQAADALVAARPIPAAAIAGLNRAASAPPLAPQIDRTGRQSWATPVTVEQVLSTLARDAITLFTGDMARRVRRCAGSDCHLIFADTSRAASRRWCSMERCGNRAKVRAFRDKHQKEESR